MKLKTRNTDIELMPREELLDLRVDLLEEQILIGIALDKAARKFESKGIPADSGWYGQNKERHKLLTIDITRIDQKLRKFKKDPAAMYKRFYEEAAAELPPKLFSSIVSRVNIEV